MPSGIRSAARSRYDSASALAARNGSGASGLSSRWASDRTSSPSVCNQPPKAGRNGGVIDSFLGVSQPMPQRGSSALPLDAAADAGLLLGVRRAPPQQRLD